MPTPEKPPAIKAGAPVEPPGSDPDSDHPGAAFHYKPGQSIGYLLRSCYRSFAKALEVHINPRDIGIGQWFFLRELWEQDGLTQRELASRVGSAAPTTAIAIRGMVKNGLVKQSPDPTDRRKKRIFLTGKGQRLKNSLLHNAREVNRDATKGFSETEIRQLRDYINKMKQNLEGE